VDVTALQGEVTGLDAEAISQFHPGAKAQSGQRAEILGVMAKEHMRVWLADCARDWIRQRAGRDQRRIHWTAAQPPQ
jgi:hypothetical protein